MRRIAFGLFLLFVSVTAVAAEVPSMGVQDAAAVQPALPVAAEPDAGAVLSALMTGGQPGSCAARTGAPAGVPVLLARPMPAPVVKAYEELPRICCDCGGFVCCPQKGTCISCGNGLCVCCNP